MRHATTSGRQREIPDGMRSEAAFTAEDRAIVRMLAAGEPPWSIARHLGVPESRVWRRRDALCARLGVTTSAELIAVAVCAGAVD